MIDLTQLFADFARILLVRVMCDNGFLFSYGNVLYRKLSKLAFLATVYSLKQDSFLFKIIVSQNANKKASIDLSVRVNIVSLCMQSVFLLALEKDEPDNCLS